MSELNMPIGDRHENSPRHQDLCAGPRQIISAASSNPKLKVAIDYARFNSLGDRTRMIFEQVYIFISGSSIAFPPLERFNLLCSASCPCS